MVELTKQEWLEKGTKLYGTDNELWEFRCPWCQRVQSAKSIREQNEKGIVTQRMGRLFKKGDKFAPEINCYSPDCDFASNGLFHSSVLVIFDPAIPHNEALKKNCIYALPFAKEE